MTSSFWTFFDELFLNKGGGRESGALKLPKMSVFGLKIQPCRRKKTKNHNFSVPKILDIGGSIRYTLRYSEKFRDIGIREFLDTIFSGLVPKQFIKFDGCTIISQLNMIDFE